MVRAVDDVPFELPRGKVIGLVGESGSGKTTIGRMVAQLIEPTSGSVRFDGLETTRLSGRQLRRLQGAHRGSAFRHVAEAWGRGQQRPRVVVPRIAEDLLGRAVLDELAVIHDRDPVGDQPHQCQIV